jgi:hypothetical protein
MVLPASPPCEVDVSVVFEVTPVVVVVEARKDSLAFGESVFHFIPVKTVSFPRVPPGVSAAGVRRRTSSSFVIVLMLPNTH